MARVLLEFLDIQDSYSCACTWSAIAFLLVVVDCCVKVRSSGGSYWKETSWGISANVLTSKVPVRLMTMGIILTSAFRVPWVWSASRGGS